MDVRTIGRFAAHRVMIVVGLVVIAALGIAMWIGHSLRDPQVVLLIPKNGAEWLRADTPFDLNIQLSKATHAEFRATLQVRQGWRGDSIKLAALRRAEVSIDDKPLFDTGPILDHWKTTYIVPLPEELAVGSHRLHVNVSNEKGPPLVRLSCPGLHPETWEASAEGAPWRSAIVASQPFEPDIQYQYDSAAVSFSHCWVLMLGLATIGTSILLKMPLGVSLVWARTGHWLILLMWLVFALRSRTVLPADIGYDVTSQFRYIEYVAKHHHLPAAHEGWEFFQAPLYYIVSAGLHSLLRYAGVAKPIDMVDWLRIIPLACSIALVEITYRAAKVTFPTRGELQLVATVVGGFVPMNFYMAPTISNEPMAAAIAAFGELMMLQIIVQPSLCTYRRMIVLGLVLGVAVLTKVTAILWLLPIEMAVFLAMRRGNRSWIDTMRSMATVPAAALMVSSWYFVHNWLTVGKVILTQTSGTWWQYPGYRTPQMFLTFGHVLTRPVYTTVRSAWDSLYGTMWGDGMLSGVSTEHALPYNFWLMSCGLLLALLPTLMIFCGVLRAAGVGAKSLGEQSVIERAALWVAVLSVCIFVAAILYMYLMTPLYGWAKATYMLGAIPCLAILAAAGFDLIARQRIVRAFIGGILFSWAITAYLTYFI